MLKHLGAIIVLLVVAIVPTAAQKLIQAGPMLGYTEFRTAKIWVEVSGDVTGASLVYHPVNNPAQKVKAIYPGKLQQAFNPLVFDLYGLEPGTSYKYTVQATTKDRKQEITANFTTQDLWMYRKPPPDFSFLAGSCSYFNQPEYDRPGTPYGGDSSIFITMSKTPADFMLWLGDNWYTRDVDYYSRWGLWSRAHYVRSQPVLQQFLAAMPHYAIWDDHDYGPNNFGESYVYKDESRNVFKNYWANPGYGLDGKGIYTQFAYGDVAFFLLDDRTWRSSDDMKDSIAGQPNPEKTMLGKQQMRWLKDALLQSRYSTFKIIAVGSQVLNTYTPYDCFYHFPAEWQELMDFISDNKIEGVIFFTGDRHHSEVLQMERIGHYKLYEVTTSPLTSHLYDAGGVEKDMPIVVKRVEGKHNFSKITISGPAKQRKLKVTYFDTKGNELECWSIGEQELQY